MVRFDFVLDEDLKLYLMEVIIFIMPVSKLSFLNTRSLIVIEELCFCLACMFLKTKHVHAHMHMRTQTNEE